MCFREGRGGKVGWWEGGGGGGEGGDGMKFRFWIGIAPIVSKAFLSVAHNISTMCEFNKRLQVYFTSCTVTQPSLIRRRYLHIRLPKDYIWKSQMHTGNEYSSMFWRAWKLMEPVKYTCNCFIELAVRLWKNDGHNNHRPRMHPSPVLWRATRTPVRRLCVLQAAGRFSSQRAGNQTPATWYTFNAQCNASS